MGPRVVNSLVRLLVKLLEERVFAHRRISVRKLSCVGVLMILMWLCSCKRYSVIRRAADYQELCSQHTIPCWDELFAPEGKNFWYWYQPGAGNGTAEYEIDEKSFISWARRKGWNLQRVKRRGQVIAAINLIHRGWDVFLDVDDGYWYEKRWRVNTPYEEPRENHFTVYYDISDRKAYLEFGTGH